MTFGFGLRLGFGSGKSGAPALVPLYTTADMVIEGAPNAEILGPDSIRYCRVGTVGRLRINDVPSGNYRVTGTLAAYDGAVSGVVAIRLEITDTFTNRAALTAAGAFDEVVSITSGIMRFQTATGGGGGLVTNLFIGAA